VFWGFSNSTGKSILNNLEVVYLGDVYVQQERIAGVPKFISVLRLGHSS